MCCLGKCCACDLVVGYCRAAWWVLLLHGRQGGVQIDSGYGGVVGWFDLTRVLWCRRYVFVYLVECGGLRRFQCTSAVQRAAQAAWSSES